MRNAQPHFCFETMIKKAYSLLLAVFFAGMICAEENGSAGMSVSAEVSADAQASSAPSFGNDGIDRMAPDFVTVSLVLTGPEDAIYSVAGHACLRLECPTFQHDYCFTYESEDVEDKVLSFFTGNLKMGMFRVPTDLFLKVNGGGRGVWAYKLQLPPDAELRLWQVLDNLVTQEATLPYDYIRRGCAKSRVCQLKIPKSRSRPSPHAFSACGLLNNYMVAQNGFTADFNSLMSPFV